MWWLIGSSGCLRAGCYYVWFNMCSMWRHLFGPRLSKQYGCDPDIFPFLILEIMFCTARKRSADTYVYFCCFIFYTSDVVGLLKGVVAPDIMKWFRNDFSYLGCVSCICDISTFYERTWYGFEADTERAYFWSRVFSDDSWQVKLLHSVYLTFYIFLTYILIVLFM